MWADSGFEKRDTLLSVDKLTNDSGDFDSSKAKDTFNRMVQDWVIQDSEIPDTPSEGLKRMLSAHKTEIFESFNQDMFQNAEIASEKTFKDIQALWIFSSAQVLDSNWVVSTFNNLKRYRVSISSQGQLSAIELSQEEQAIKKLVSDIRKDGITLGEAEKILQEAGSITEKMHTRKVTAWADLSSEMWPEQVVDVKVLQWSIDRVTSLNTDMISLASAMKERSLIAENIQKIEGVIEGLIDTVASANAQVVQAKQKVTKVQDGIVEMWNIMSHAQKDVDSAQSILISMIKMQAGGSAGLSGYARINTWSRAGVESRVKEARDRLTDAELRLRSAKEILKGERWKEDEAKARLEKAESTLQDEELKLSIAESQLREAEPRLEAINIKIAERKANLSKVNAGITNRDQSNPDDYLARIKRDKLRDQFAQEENTLYKPLTDSWSADE